MTVWKLLGIALGLSMDAFAVAVASSIALVRLGRRRIFRLSFHFGLFQGLMPVIGWLVGVQVGPWLHAIDHWIAFGLLAFLGGRSIHEALHREPDESPLGDPTRGWRMVLLSLATSIDALAVGLIFALEREEILWPALVIGVVCGTLTMVGMKLGSRVGRRFGVRLEVAGGLVLVAIGLKILLEHLGW